MYNLIYFTEGDKQNNFINSNLTQISNIIKGCIPLNRTINNTTIYDQFIINYIKDHTSRTSNVTWYFLVETSTKSIAALCFVSKISFVYKFSQSVPTYTLLPEKDLTNIRISDQKIEPVLYALCKDKSYPKVGQILLNHIFDILKPHHQAIYLIQESILFKDNYSEIYKINNCSFIDISKYKESNNKLTSYYIDLGFIPCPLTYSIHKCYKTPHYIFFNVFKKTLDSKQKYTSQLSLPH